MKHQLTIEYGDEILAGLGLSPDEFSREARLLLAAKLYDLGRLTQLGSGGSAVRHCTGSFSTGIEPSRSSRQQPAAGGCGGRARVRTWRLSAW